MNCDVNFLYYKKNDEKNNQKQHKGLDKEISDD